MSVDECEMQFNCEAENKVFVEMQTEKEEEMTWAQRMERINARWDKLYVIWLQQNNQHSTIPVADHTDKIQCENKIFNFQGK